MLADADELLALFSTCPNDTMNGPGDSMTALRAELKAKLVSLSKLHTLTLPIKRGRVVRVPGRGPRTKRAGWVLFGLPDQTAVLAPQRGALLLRLQCVLVGVFLG